jgi:hypothetical protein
MVTTSAPYLKLQLTDSGRPLSATFIAYFKLEDTRVSNPQNLIQFVPEPDDFRPDVSSPPAPYRLVRINFFGGLYGRVLDAEGDYEIVREKDYDWSEMPAERRPSEAIDEYLKRGEEYWVRTGLSPSPRIFEVKPSPWIEEIGEDPEILRHCLIFGQDEYVEVLAQDWDWERGQPVR